MSDSESGNEVYKFEESTSLWSKFKNKLKKALPKRWRAGGTGMSEKVTSTLKALNWKPNPNATISDLQKIAEEKSPLEKVIATLDQKNFWKPDEGEDWAISGVAESLETEDETYVKGWVVVKINERDQEQERVLILSDRAYYTARYDYSSGKVSKIRRHDLANYQYMRLGTLLGSKWTITGNIKNTLPKSYGFIITLKETKPSLLQRASAKVKREEGIYYERAFRARTTADLDGQKRIMTEIAWGIYAVANRLENSDYVNKPAETDLYRPGKMGTGTLTLAFNALGLGKTSDAKKKAHAEKKENE